MVKEIALLIIGGFVTFVFTYFINRLSLRKPNLLWRILPPVALPSQNLTAFNILISNQGNLGVKNVRTVISFPREAEIKSVEIQPSESALTFERRNVEEKNLVECFFPYFHSQIECMFSLLAAKTA